MATCMPLLVPALALTDHALVAYVLGLAMVDALAGATDGGLPVDDPTVIAEKLSQYVLMCRSSSSRHSVLS